MASTLVAFLLAASSIIPAAQANPVSSTNGSLERPSSSVAQCVPYTIPISITSQNLVFNFTQFKNDLDVAYIITEITRKDSNVTFHPVSGIKNVTTTYSISGTFCSPKKPSGNGREKTVLLATHGIGYDGRYWDSAYKPQEYSFVEAVVKEGYSVFYYDRLGTGKSQVVSGYTNQASIQIEILASLATLIRSGKYTGPIGTPKSLVLVGHSFGTYTSNAVLIKYPKLADAAVLTGIAYAPTNNQPNLFLAALGLRIAAQHDPRKYSSFDTGYVGFVDIAAHVTTFFKAPSYELDAVLYAHSIAAPAAITEFLTITGSPVAPAFGGPVQVTTGEFDYAFCGGECYSSFAQQPLKDIYPKSRLIDSFVHPGAGHGVNFGKNATGFYGGITAFLGKAGF
ncbi:alpha/beta-hydrolase [Ophiobolus disseminans]|uniref:Alpha/beta-hydrolase n=1 Tax=Ophiobolus disseminans TaxID=1469910 RepID=A0A6A7AD39_9PLEO|nr:alpha/beta-hydrolase [Ophiobolus disseminans]